MGAPPARLSLHNTAEIPASTEILTAARQDAGPTHGDFIKMDLGSGRRVLARGPFTRKATVPAGQWAFYINDFALTSPTPWHVPSHIEFSSDSGPTPAKPPTLASIDWQKPNQRAFEHLFTDIMARLKSGELRKVVPAVVETASWQPDLEKSLVARCFRPCGDLGSHGYAFSFAEQGAVGRTPEVLFRVEAGVLRTMALAGTVPHGREQELLENKKLLLEHDTVVEVLRERLLPLGELKIERRGLLSLQSMTHLCTKLSVRLDDANWEQKADDLIRLLHPTPALGIAPRNAQSLELLADYRREMGVPPFFGAPLGVKWPGGMLMIVAIRGLFWENDRLSLPAGCGIVSGSDFASEWAELELKRQWIRHAFGC